MEEILQEEILDETDKYIDVAKRIKVAQFRNKISRGDIFTNQSTRTDVSFHF